MESNSSLTDLCRSDGDDSPPSASCNGSYFSFANSSSDQPPSFGLDLSDPVTDAMVKHNQRKTSYVSSAAAHFSSSDAAPEVCADEDIIQSSCSTSVFKINAQANKSLITGSKESQLLPMSPMHRDIRPPLRASQTRQRDHVNASSASARKVHSRKDHAVQAVLVTRNRISATNAVAAATVSSSTGPVQAYPGSGSLQKLRDWTVSAQSSLESQIKISADLAKLKKDAIQTTFHLNDAIARALELDNELKQQRREIEELEQILERDSSRKR